jgi:hypothetical protein
MHRPRLTERTSRTRDIQAQSNQTSGQRTGCFFLMHQTKVDNATRQDKRTFALSFHPPSADQLRRPHLFRLLFFVVIFLSHLDPQHSFWTIIAWRKKLKVPLYLNLPIVWHPLWIETFPKGATWLKRPPHSCADVYNAHGTKAYFGRA